MTGVAGATPVASFTATPAEWLPLIRRFVAINRAMDGPDAFIAARIKQWLVLAHQDGRMPWILPLKRARDLAGSADSN